MSEESKKSSWEKFIEEPISPEGRRVALQCYNRPSPAYEYIKELERRREKSDERERDLAFIKQCVADIKRNIQEKSDDS